MPLLRKSRLMPLRPSKPPPPLLRFDRSPQLPSLVLLFGTAALRVSGLFLPRLLGDITGAGSTMFRLELRAPVSSSIIVYYRMLFSVSPISLPLLSNSSRSIFDRLFGFFAFLVPNRSSSSKRIPFFATAKLSLSSSSPIPIFSSPLTSRLKSSSRTSFLYRLPVGFIFLLGEGLFYLLLCSSGSNGATKFDLFNDFFLPKILRPTGVGSESY